MKLLFLNKSKKYITGFLVSVLLFGLFFGQNNAKAFPGDIVYDPTTAALVGKMQAEVSIFTANQIKSNAESSMWEKAVKFFSDKAYQIQKLINDKSSLVKEYVLDPLVWTAANVIIDKFADSLVTWIQSGFEGSPMFLSRPDQFFKDAANDLSGAVINDLNMNWLCTSLGKFKLQLDFFFPGTSKSKYACTFEDILGNINKMSNRDGLGDWLSVNFNITQQNVVKKYGNDFRNGGWPIWLLFGEDKNTKVGRTIAMANDVYAASEEKTQKEKFGLGLNGGFFGVRTCLEYYPLAVADTTKAGKCKSYKTTSPGHLVQDQLDHAANKDLARLQVADEIDEVIGALATTMMGWLLTGGNDSGGVLGYDSKADYSGSNRDHYGVLSKSQNVTSKKTNISNQITNIKNNEEQYNGILENYADALYGTKEKLEAILAKLKCIRATSTNDTSNTYADSDCDGASEDTKNIKLSSVDKTESQISSDISKTESQISSVDSKISSFTGKYGDNATSTSAQALDLFDGFEGKAVEASSLGNINSLVDEYCYSYDKTNKTGKICGLLGAKSASDSLAVYISAESNPVTQDSAGNIKTKIYWKAINAESCQATGGDGDKSWKKTEISTSGSYTTANFTESESRTYGVKCSDAKNNTETKEVSISAGDSSSVKSLSGSLFAKTLFVKSGESSSLYWLSSNASQCYLYSDQDSFSGDAEYVTSTSTGLYENEGYYLKTSLTKTTGQTTATFNSGETFKYKLICGDSNGAYSVLSELEIASEDGEKETYKTHSEKEYKAIIKEEAKIETKMENVALEYSCILNDYTQAEDVSKSECGSFESSSSSSS